MDAVVWIVSSLVGIVFAFYLGLFAGKQARYVGLAALHPLRWFRNEWLCPNCLGTFHVDNGPCFFCLRCIHLLAEKSGVPYDQSRLGHVDWRYLIREWDWRHWCQQPVPRETRARADRS
jgi:hypothetical protein